MYKVATTAAVLELPAGAGSTASASDWSGFYVGAKIGAASTSLGTHGQDVFDGGEGGIAPAAIGFDDTPFRDRNSPTDFAGTADVGYDFDAGVIVIGVEGDVSLLNGGKTNHFAGPVGTDSVSNNINNIETVRLKVGVPVDNFLIYGTFGGAFSDAHARFVSAGGETAELREGYGWAAGGGVETFVAPVLSVSAQGLYVDLSPRTATPAAEFSFATLQSSSHVFLWTVGLNYHI